jgi:cytidine deaminase
MISDEALIDLARKAREMAHAPYSNFEVGAALITADGRVFTGCNIENSTYSLTVCAERVAIFKAVSEGSREIAKIAVVVDTENLTPPCGCCRQMIWEFAAEETTVIMANLSGDVSKCEIKELLPKAFDGSFLVGVG